MSFSDLPQVPFVPVPSPIAQSSYSQTQHISPIVSDEKAITRLLLSIIQHSGLTVPEVARRMGVSTSTVKQYIYGRRTRPSIQWLVRLVGTCGARLLIEYPSEARRPR